MPLCLAESRFFKNRRVCLVLVFVPINRDHNIKFLVLNTDPQKQKTYVFTCAHILPCFLLLAFLNCLAGNCNGLQNVFNL